MSKGTPAWDHLSTDSAQLLLCDLQPEIVACSKTIHRDVLSKSAGVLLEIAKLFSLPTTLSMAPEGDKAPELISELRGSGFAQEKLRASAQSRRKVLIIGGFATEAVVLHAVLDARASLRGVGPSGRLWRNIRGNRTGCSKAHYSRGSNHHLSRVNCNQARPRLHGGSRQGPF